MQEAASVAWNISEVFYKERHKTSREVAWEQLIIKEESAEAKVIQWEICLLHAGWISSRCLQVSIKLMLKRNRETSRPQSVQQRQQLYPTSPPHSLLKPH